MGSNDEWGTPVDAFAALDPYLPEGAVVWDPFFGHESGRERLRAGLTHASVVHHFPCDAFSTPVPPGTTHIVTNPPYSTKHECLAWLGTLGLPCAVMLPLQTITTIKFQSLPFARDVQVIVSGSRIKFHPRHVGPATGSPPWTGVWICWGLDLPRDITFTRPA